MGLLSDIEAEIEFVHLTAAGRVAVVFWSCMGHSYRELDPSTEVKLVRREAVAS
jgi:hypothetical protein